MTCPYEVWVTMALDLRVPTRTFISPNNDISMWNFKSPDNQPIYYVAQEVAAFPQIVLKTRAAIAPGKRLAEVVASPAPGSEKFFAITAISPTFAKPMPQMIQRLARIIQAPVEGNPDTWSDATLTDPVSAFQDLS